MPLISIPSKQQFCTKSDGFCQRRLETVLNNTLDMKQQHIFFPTEAFRKPISSTLYMIPEVRTLIV
jgi:hypothetical protein